MLVGFTLVTIFMVIYYKGAGMIADLALIVNIVLIGGGLAAFQATLTLPGIAGIILTIGMAVDANVIIFERIREELRAGKTALAAVHAGYERATLTIMDANVTDCRHCSVPVRHRPHQGICRDPRSGYCGQSVHGPGIVKKPL